MPDIHDIIANLPKYVEELNRKYAYAHPEVTKGYLQCVDCKCPIPPFTGLLCGLCKMIVDIHNQRKVERGE